MAPLPSPPSKTVEAIYSWHVERQGIPWRSAGIAVSELGTECDRAVWYRFRWADANEPVEGRKARLFETGNLEEARLIAELRSIGCEVIDRDSAGKQIALRGVAGHLRGKADGVVLGVPDAPKTWHLLEIKTHSAKNFKLLTKGVEAAFPKHYVQCQIGMHHLIVGRALYLATCKDTDELYAERIEYDVEFCLRAEARARRIAFSDYAPAKLHEDPDSKAAWQCKFCPALRVCHEGCWPERNCRTCLASSPTEAGDGEWRCELWGKVLTLAEQKAGCPSHLYLPDLVPGEQVDQQGETVTYLMPGGEVWVDGAREAA